jgi:hypothetical protein
VEPEKGTLFALQAGIIQLEALIPVPLEVVTETTPEPAAPAIAVICVVVLTVNELTLTPPIETEVAPVKLVPVITTVVEFAQPPVGVKEEIVGAEQEPE